MISLLFVGDGPRDSAMLPRLVEGILHTEVTEEAHHWKDIRLNKGTGYGRKLLFALRQAQDAHRHGLVAVVDGDNDKDGDRLKELHNARDKERQQRPPFPTALGQAVPHGDVWLLDDPVAVRGALRLSGSVQVENVRKIKDAKAALQSLIEGCERAADALLEVLADIARQVDGARCNHAAETGFEGFVKDVMTELSPVAKELESQENE